MLDATMALPVVRAVASPREIFETHLAAMPPPGRMPPPRAPPLGLALLAAK